MGDNKCLAVSAAACVIESSCYSRLDGGYGFTRGNQVMSLELQLDAVTREVANPPGLSKGLLFPSTEWLGVISRNPISKLLLQLLEFLIAGQVFPFMGVGPVVVEFI